MKKFLFGLLVISSLLIAQVSLSSLQILAWDTTNGRVAWYTLGSGFTKTGNVISVTPVTGPTQVKNVKLTPVNNTYPLPADASTVNLTVYVNGLRYIPPSDYTINNRIITPSCLPDSVDCNWSRNALVVIDYEK